MPAETKDLSKDKQFKKNLKNLNMSSQIQHPNEILISGSNDSTINTNSDGRLGYHNSNRHIHHNSSALNIMPQINPNTTCPCTHHYHHIHHHHPTTANPTTTTTATTTPQQQNLNGGHYNHQQSYNNRHNSNSGCLNHRQSLHSCHTDETSDNRQISGETHAAVTVHQQSQQQQQHHQYQVLDLNDDESNCDCHLRNNHQHHDTNDRSSRLCLGSGGNVVGDGESIIPSSSEDSQVHKCIHHRKNKNHLGNQQRRISSRGKGIIKSRENEEDYSSRIEVYSDGTDSGVKINDGGTSEEDQGPPLPPRPPPRMRNMQDGKEAPFSTRVKKYVVWCLISGGCSCILGAMFLGVYFLLRSYTSTVGYFETVPTFVPATLLILTGLCIISLARRRNRYSFLIKLSGVCGLASALICALVTVTTTVLHMSRLQALRECEYSTKARTCTCYSTTIEPQLESDGDVVTFVFDSTSDCGLVHGALYSCLRAIFGLSVAGVLVAVFSCMLVYQLLSHERKKMYWEQLELRCRSLYESQQAPPPLPPGPPTGPSIIGTQMTMNTSCRCCEQCHTHRQSMPPSAVYPWDGTNRFWTSAGGQPQPLGNYYSPNPVGDELPNSSLNGNRQNSQRNGNSSGRTSGWSWPRMPWQRNNSNRNNTTNVTDQNARLFRQSPASPDSQYGFSNNPPGSGGGGPTDGNGIITNVVQVPNQQGSYSIIGGLPYGVWGPPPPYSDPNSPARRGRYQYIQPNQCPAIMDHQMQPTQQQIPNLECHQHSSSTDSHTIEAGFCSPQNRNMIKRQSGFKTKDNYENTPSDSDGPRDRFSNTLPVRKMKKRVEVGAKSIGPNSNTNQPPQRVNVQNVFQPIRSDMEEPEYHEPRNPNDEPSVSPTNISSNSSSSAGTESNCQQTKLKRVKIGVENSGFQNAENENIKNNAVVRIMDPSTESEVYFADVSSCCNISVKNDNYYDDANKRRTENGDSSAKEENEDYLSQRFGKRENSIRSRLPFPQIIPGNENYDKNQMNLPIITPRQSLIPKDLSRQSMCSVESGEKTDYTDLSPATPCSNFQSQVPSSSSSSQQQPTIETIESNINTNFVASYPFSSNEQSQEAHRRSTKNIHELFLAPDAQYEIVKDSNQYETEPLTMAFEQEMSFVNNNNNNNNNNNSTNNNNNNINNNNKSSATSHSHRSPKSSKNLNLTPIKRTNLGTNITSIIQNLSSNDSGLLYPESTDQENQENKLNGQQQLQQQQQQTVIVTALSNSDNEWSDSSDRRL